MSQHITPPHTHELLADLEAMSTVANYYEGTLTTPSIEPSYKSAVSWYSHTHTHTHIHIHNDIQDAVGAQRHAHTYTHTYTRTYTHIHTHIHSETLHSLPNTPHTHIHAHIHTRIRL